MVEKNYKYDDEKLFLMKIKKNEIKNNSKYGMLRIIFVGKYIFFVIIRLNMV